MTSASRDDGRVLRYISSMEPRIDSHRTLDDASASIRCSVDEIVGSIERMIEAGLLAREQVAQNLTFSHRDRQRSIRLTLAGRRLLESAR